MTNSHDGGGDVLAGGDCAAGLCMRIEAAEGSEAGIIWIGVFGIGADGRVGNETAVLERAAGLTDLGYEGEWGNAFLGD